MAREMTFEEFRKDMEKSLEMEHGGEIFTMRFWDSEKENEMDTLVVFKDEYILKGKIIVDASDDGLQVNFKLNYI
jgi:hypothetical protein